MSTLHGPKYVGVMLPPFLKSFMLTLKIKHIYKIQQATTITEQLLILHDEWVYEVCDRYQKNSACVVFGVTANLLVSGSV